MDEVKALCDALPDLPQAHVQFTLLRACLAGGRVMDLLRASPLLQGGTECSRFSAIQRDALGTVQGQPLSDRQWTQSTLRIHLGGLGILDPERARLSARLAGIVDFCYRLVNLPVAQLGPKPHSR